MSEVKLEDIYKPEKFAEQYPDLLNGPGLPKLPYLLRHRHSNDLVKSGAVIEPTERRPLIVAPRFLEWLLSRKSAA